MLWAKEQYWEQQAKARHKSLEKMLTCGKQDATGATCPTPLWGRAFPHGGSHAEPGRVALLNNAGTRQARATHPAHSA